MAKKRQQARRSQHRKNNNNAASGSASSSSSRSVRFLDLPSNIVVRIFTELFPVKAWQLAQNFPNYFEARRRLRARLICKGINELIMRECEEIGFEDEPEDMSVDADPKSFQALAHFPPNLQTLRLELRTPINRARSNLWPSTLTMLSLTGPGDAPTLDQGVLAALLLRLDKLRDLTVDMSSISGRADRVLTGSGLARLHLVHNARETDQREADHRKGIPKLPSGLRTLVLSGKRPAAPLWVNYRPMPPLTSLTLSIAVNPTVVEAMPATIVNFEMSRGAWTTNVVELVSAKFPQGMPVLESFTAGCLYSGGSDDGKMITATVLKKFASSVLLKCKKLSMGAEYSEYHEDRHSTPVPPVSLDVKDLPKEVESLVLGPDYVLRVARSTKLAHTVFPLTLTSLGLYGHDMRPNSIHSKESLAILPFIPSTLTHLALWDISFAPEDRLWILAKRKLKNLSSLSLPACAFVRPIQIVRNFVSSFESLHTLTIRGHGTAPRGHSGFNAKTAVSVTDSLLDRIPKSTRRIVVDGLHKCSAARIARARAEGVVLELAGESAEYYRRCLDLGVDSRGEAFYCPDDDEYRDSPPDVAMIDAVAEFWHSQGITEVVPSILYEPDFPEGPWARPPGVSAAEGETDTEEVPGLVSDDDEYEASDGHEGDEDEDEDEDDDEDNDDDSSDSGDGGDGNDEIPGLASDSDGGPPGLVSDDESPRGLEGDSDSGPPGLVSYESGSESGPLGLLSDDSEAEAEADNGPPGLVSDDAWETDDGPPGLVSDRDDDEDDAPSFKKTPVPNSKLTTAPKSKSANGSKAGEPINAKVVKESAAASRERETGGPAAPHKPPVRGSGHMISQPLPPPTKSAQPPAASTRGSASGTRGSTSASATGRSTFGAAAPQRPPAPAPTPAATDVPAAEDMPDLVSDSDDDLAPVGTGAWARQMASNRGGARKGR
ncbi:hypothetical protein BDK51DRAFT_29680 [Blyttiomyces helicus]|uniref:Uncharacterized protein n=1 Tax=Blyttiomyces helicus TaxID=388810 RepID=A0A4P9WEB6_9FUNG|nr:hypothetical protein BDK51DRAFT_29680 [Blyttiomyces helicus]|eukprot:RKO90043.1 hypothetical protein BDK51DRAFT_29680 [Blyttiomyces helicus]